MVRSVLASLALCTCLAPALRAETASYRFVWEGDNGYKVTGAMSFDAGLISQRIVTEGDMICFFIEGTVKDEPLGRWALSMLNEQTTWRLHFDARSSQFLVEGMGPRMPQAWNMNGAGSDCGMGGFGFNLGNLGQDLCIDNEVILDSRIDPFEPFPALRDDSLRFPGDACLGPDLLSGLPGPGMPRLARSPG